jgi:hypothetical protein
MNIQNDSGGKVNILEANIIGHCEEKFRIYICLILNGYPNRTNIENDSGRKVSILEANIIGHCEEKFRINIYLILNGYRSRVLWVFGPPLNFLMLGLIKNEVCKKKADPRDELLAGNLDPEIRMKKSEGQLRRPTCDLDTYILVSYS